MGQTVKVYAVGVRGQMGWWRRDTLKCDRLKIWSWLSLVAIEQSAEPTLKIVGQGTLRMSSAHKLV